jgi:predicted RNase H-like nuclease (RuvC/YqgF family)
MIERKPEALIGVFVKQLNAALADENAALLAEIEQLKKRLAIWERNGGDILQQSEIDKLQDQIKTLRELREYDQAEIRRLRAAVSHVRMRSAHAGEMLNEFDNTYRAMEPKP